MRKRPLLSLVVASAGIEIMIGLQRVEAVLGEVGDTTPAFRIAINESIRDSGGGEVSFSDLGNSASAENDSSGRFDAEVEFPPTGNSGGSTSWSDNSSGSTDTKSWRQTENTSPLVPSCLNTTTIPLHELSSLSSGEHGPSVSLAVATSSASEDSSYATRTVTALGSDDPQDNTGADFAPPCLTGSTTETDQPPTKSSPDQPSSGNSDKSSSGDNSSGTSAVTTSPLFYASIVLVAVGLIGIIVGYRAKRKRNHHRERRAFRMSMRRSTRRAAPAPDTQPTSPPSSDVHVQFDNHSTVAL